MEGWAREVDEGWNGEWGVPPRRGGAWVPGGGVRLGNRGDCARGFDLAGWGRSGAAPLRGLHHGAPLALLAELFDLRESGRDCSIAEMLRRGRR